MATWQKTRLEILKRIKGLECCVKSLTTLSEGVRLPRKFTLDGRLVGDIGELLVFMCFENVCDDKPKGLPHVHDLGVYLDGKLLGVQVKVRRVTGKAAKLPIKYQPDVLIVIEFEPDWSKWRIVFNGNGNVLLRNGVVADNKRRLRANGQPTETAFTLEEFSDKQRDKKFSTPSLRLIK